MKAARLHQSVTRFVVEEVDDPIARDGSVVIRVTRAFLPTFFKPLAEGAFATPGRPFTTGQCAIGVVEDPGSYRGELKPGARVYCDMYLETVGSGGREDYGFIGCFGPGADSAQMLAEWPDGTFAEKVILPRECIVPIPDTTKTADDVLCRLGWLSTAYEGLRRGAFVPGQRVAINGASGLLGASAALVAQAMGAGSVEIYGRRGALLEDLAALSPVISIGSEDSRYDLILECSGGDKVNRTTELIGRLVRGGTMSFVGALTSPLSLDASLLMRANLNLIGSFTPGAKTIYGQYTASVSLRTGAPMAGTPEIALINFAVGQLARMYGLPWRTTGSQASSKVFDAQSGYESAPGMMTAILGGANLILHAGGWDEAGLVNCFAKFIVDCEQNELYYRLGRGIMFDRLDEAVEAIRGVPPSGHYLGEAFTMKYFEDAFAMPEVLDFSSHPQWTAEGEKDLGQRARETARGMLAKYQAPELDTAISEELDAFINRRKSEINPNLT